MRPYCRLAEGGPHSFANSCRVVSLDCSGASSGTSAVAFGGSVRYVVHPARTNSMAVSHEPPDRLNGGLTDLPAEPRAGSELRKSVSTCGRNRISPRHARSRKAACSSGGKSRAGLKTSSRRCSWSSDISADTSSSTYSCDAAWRFPSKIFIFSVLAASGYRPIPQHPPAIPTPVASHNNESWMGARAEAQCGRTFAPSGESESTHGGFQIGRHLSPSDPRIGRV